MRFIPGLCLIISLVFTTSAGELWNCDSVLETSKAFDSIGNCIVSSFKYYYQDSQQYKVNFYSSDSVTMAIVNPHINNYYFNPKDTFKYYRINSYFIVKNTPPIWLGTDSIIFKVVSNIMYSKSMSINVDNTTTYFYVNPDSCALDSIIPTNHNRMKFKEFITYYSKHSNHVSYRISSLNQSSIGKLYHINIFDIKGRRIGTFQDMINIKKVNQFYIGVKNNSIELFTIHENR